MADSEASALDAGEVVDGCLLASMKAEILFLTEKCMKLEADLVEASSASAQDALAHYQDAGFCEKCALMSFKQFQLQARFEAGRRQHGLPHRVVAERAICGKCGCGKCAPDPFDPSSPRPSAAVFRA